MKGILLINLGSPDNPGTPAVRRYLREFLMDERVIDIPWLARKALVEGCILPFRPRRSAEAYRAIWTPQGSPLIVISESVRMALQQRLQHPVALGMRYGNPSITAAVQSLLTGGADELCILPLYPHYAMSSYETALVEALHCLPRGMAYSVVPPFYEHPAYIRALSASAAGVLDGGFDHLLFSFHGIPMRHLKKRGCHGCYNSPCGSDTCYLSHCLKTAIAIARAAGIAEGRYSVAFQSRLGRDPWLQPRTDLEIERLAKSGVRSLAVICPSFVTDCLETLEEIGIRGRDVFEAAGGKKLLPVPCLNDHPAFIEALVELISVSANSCEWIEGRRAIAGDYSAAVDPR